MSRAPRRDIQEALEAWAATVLCGVTGLGWPQYTTLGRILDEGPTGAAIRPFPGPRMPRVRYGGRYWAVSRALRRPELHPDCRVIAAIEAGLLNDAIRPQAGAAERARVIGMTPWTYRRRLRTLRQYIGAELGRMAQRRVRACG